MLAFCAFQVLTGRTFLSPESPKIPDHEMSLILPFSALKEGRRNGQSPFFYFSSRAALLKFDILTVAPSAELSREHRSKLKPKHLFGNRYGSDMSRQLKSLLPTTTLHPSSKSYSDESCPDFCFWNVVGTFLYSWPQI